MIVTSTWLDHLRTAAKTAGINSGSADTVVQFNELVKNASPKQKETFEAEINRVRTSLNGNE